MNTGDFAWKTSRLWLSPLTFFLARTRAYGRGRVARQHLQIDVLRGEEGDRVGRARP